MSSELHIEKAMLINHWHKNFYSYFCGKAQT